MLHDHIPSANDFETSPPCHAPADMRHITFLTCRVVLRGFIKIYFTKAPFILNSQQQVVALLHVSELSLPHIPRIFIAFAGMSLVILIGYDLTYKWITLNCFIW